MSFMPYAISFVPYAACFAAGALFGFTVAALMAAASKPGRGPGAG